MSRLKQVSNSKLAVILIAGANVWALFNVIGYWFQLPVGLAAIAALLLFPVLAWLFLNIADGLVATHTQQTDQKNNNPSQTFLTRMKHVLLFLSLNRLTKNWRLIALLAIGLAFTLALAGNLLNHAAWLKFSDTFLFYALLLPLLPLVQPHYLINQRWFSLGQIIRLLLLNLLFLICWTLTFIGLVLLARVSHLPVSLSGLLAALGGFYLWYEVLSTHQLNVLQGVRK